MKRITCIVILLVLVASVKCKSVEEELNLLRREMAEFKIGVEKENENIKRDYENIKRDNKNIRAQVEELQAENQQLSN